MTDNERIRELEADLRALNDRSREQDAENERLRAELRAVEAERDELADAADRYCQSSMIVILRDKGRIRELEERIREWEDGKMHRSVTS